MAADHSVSYDLRQMDVVQVAQAVYEQAASRGHGERLCVTVVVSSEVSLTGTLACGAVSQEGVATWVHGLFAQHSDLAVHELLSRWRNPAAQPEPSTGDAPPVDAEGAESDAKSSRSAKRSAKE